MLSLLLLSHLSGCSAFVAPITNITRTGNTTASKIDIAPSWVSEPPGRGTWKILYSCVFTLVLCVWTSVHLNVPGHGESSWQQYRRKAKWVVIALFAPEVVVYFGFQQWLTAKMFLRELQKLHDCHSPGLEGKPFYQKEHVFNMTYALFAVMGGFAVDIEHLHNKMKRATLTTNGILVLAQRGHFLYVDPDSIADKSKANVLGKGLVCVQVLWVVGQAIERKVAGLPISLLEYHTLAHVICALIMYALWFQKPYDIQHPIMVSTQDFPEALAFIVASSRWRGHSGFTSLRHRSWFERMKLLSPQDTDPKFAWFGSLEGFMSSADNVSLVHTTTRTEVEPLDRRVQDHSYLHTRNVPRNEYVRGEILREYAPVQECEGVITLVASQSLSSGLGPLPGCRIRLSEKDVLRLNLAGNFIQNSIALLDGDQSSAKLPKATFNDPVDIRRWADRQLPISNVFEPKTFRPYGQSMIAPRIWNTAGGSDLLDFKDDKDWASSIMNAAFIVIPLAYGAVHLAGVHFTFPTAIEAILWRASCYVLLGVVGLSSLLYFAVWIVESVFDSVITSWIDHESIGGPGLVGAEVFLASALVVVPLYFAARTFIVVESFISLRHIPAAVYQTPESNIMDYIPHL